MGKKHIVYLGTFYMDILFCVSITSFASKEFAGKSKII